MRVWFDVFDVLPYFPELSRKKAASDKSILL